MFSAGNVRRAVTSGDCLISSKGQLKQCVNWTTGHYVYRATLTNRFSEVKIISEVLQNRRRRKLFPPPKETDVKWTRLVPFLQNWNKLKSA